jgi:hypothetical protein
MLEPAVESTSLIDDLKELVTEKFAAHAIDSQR